MTQCSHSRRRSKWKNTQSGKTPGVCDESCLQSVASTQHVWSTSISNSHLHCWGWVKSVQFYLINLSLFFFFSFFLIVSDWTLIFLTGIKPVPTPCPLQSVPRGVGSVWYLRRLKRWYVEGAECLEMLATISHLPPPEGAHAHGRSGCPLCETARESERERGNQKSALDPWFSNSVQASFSSMKIILAYSS